jgi:hypothetical protein
MYFYGEELLAPRPTPKLEDHPLSAVRDCLFYIFAAALYPGGRSSIRTLRTHHAVVRGTHLSLICNKMSKYINVYPPKDPQYVVIYIIKCPYTTTYICPQNYLSI